MTPVAPDGALSRGVLALMREAAATALMPRFGGPLDRRYKAPGELVTDADRHSEELLRAGLARLDPGARFVGEEAASEDPSLLDQLGDGAAWIVDPLDGTANFAAGDSRFGIMVALAIDGQTAAGWIYSPSADRAYAAGAGMGAMRDGEALVVKPLSPSPSPPAGRVGLSALWGDEAARERAAGALSRHFTPVPLVRCAAVVYPLIAEGGLDVALFRRTLPWDHAAGALLLEESGGWARRPDGRAYRPDSREEYLVAAADRDCGARAYSLASEGADG